MKDIDIENLGNKLENESSLREQRFKGRIKRVGPFVN